MMWSVLICALIMGFICLGLSLVLHGEAE